MPVELIAWMAMGILLLIAVEEAGIVYLNRYLYGNQVQAGGKISAFGRFIFMKARGPLLVRILQTAFRRVFTIMFRVLILMKADKAYSFLMKKFRIREARSYLTSFLNKCWALIKPVIQYSEKMGKSLFNGALTAVRKDRKSSSHL